VSKRVGFVLKREKPEAETIARQLIPWLVSRGHEALVAPENGDVADHVTVLPDDEMGARVDLLVVLGGDGTLLHGGGLVGDRAVPILGINLGHLGFIVPFAPAEAQSALERAIAGELPVEDRLRLRVRLQRAAGGVTERFALNDAVIAQGAMAKLIELQASLDGQAITTYRADGLIVATPTGSTAYNLAAGGPIMAPLQHSVAITPICPHTLTNRPLVVSSSSTIQIALGSASASVMLTVDGQWGYGVANGDRVEITKASQPLRLFVSQKGYFEILREKLMWGSRAS
jgi:NAD+ kinase